MNYDLFTVYWLLISFIIIAIIVAPMELYYIFSAVCDTIFWMHYFCVICFFVSSKNIIVDYFLVCLSIYFTLQVCMYNCHFTVGSNIFNGFYSLSYIIILEYVDAVSLILFSPGISISSWSS